GAGQTYEHAVDGRLTREGDTGDVAYGRRESLRHRVGTAGVADPQVVGEERVELRRHEAHLRRQLRGLLAHELHVGPERRVAEDDGLAVHHAVLGPAEAHD